MKQISEALGGLKVLELKRFSDERGFFEEFFNQSRLDQFGIHGSFVQINHSMSVPRVLRGLHFQADPPQSKLVGCIKGRIWDVAVDLRKNSPTYAQHFAAEISEANGRLMWIPYGFAHGFCVLGDESAHILYAVNGIYNAKTEGGLRWDDKSLAIPWPLKNPIVSARDQVLSTLAEISPLE